MNAETAKKIAEGNKPRWRQAVERLTPLNRVHAGPDMTAAYKLLGEHYPVDIFGYPAGSRSGSWEAPPGWKINKACLTGPGGKIIIEWDRHSVLSLFAYSPPFRGTVSRRELEDHIFSDPARPDETIFHFRNQYRLHEAQWGFSLPHKVRQALPDGDYAVEIDTEYTSDDMLMALQTHKGDRPDSVLFVGHFDHPGQCGDGLLGCIAGHEALTRLQGRRTKLTWRMLSTVEIVGSVFYAEKRAAQDGVRQALFSALSGVDAPLVYATTARGDSILDRVMAHVLRHIPEETRTVPFRDPSAIGNDEVAYDVEGVNIPCGSLMRWPYRHYHSSLDTVNKAHDDRFEIFVEALLSTIEIFEENATLQACFKGLPRLSAPEIGLYLSPPSLSGVKQEADAATDSLMERLGSSIRRQQARAAGEQFNYMMTLLPALADGQHTVLDIAEKSGVPFAVAALYTDMWVEKGLLKKAWVDPFSSRGAS